MREADLERYLKESMMGVPKTLSHRPVRAETPLFAHVLRVDKSVKGSPLHLSENDSQDG